MIKQRLKSNISYSSIIFFVMFIVILTLILIFNLSFSSDNILTTIICNIFFGLCCLISFALFLLNIQFIELESDKMILKCCGLKIKTVNWTDIVVVEIKKLETLSSSIGYKLYKQWIVISDIEEVKVKRGGLNGNKLPWTIIATHQNIKILKDFIISNNINIKNINL